MKNLTQQQKEIVVDSKNLSQIQFITKYSDDISKARLFGDKYEEVEIQLLNEKLTIVWHLRKGCYTYYGFTVVPTSEYKIINDKKVVSNV